MGLVGWILCVVPIHIDYRSPAPTPTMILRFFPSRLFAKQIILCKSYLVLTDMKIRQFNQVSRGLIGMANYFRFIIAHNKLTALYFHHIDIESLYSLDVGDLVPGNNTMIE